MKLRIALIVALVFVGALGGAYYYSKSQPHDPSRRVVIPGVLHAGHPEFDRYRGLVKIVAGPGEVGTNFRGDPIAVVSFSLVNLGDRKLEAVEVRVSLFDRQGQRVREAIKTPLQPGLLPHRPLQPLESWPFTFWVDSIPVTWDTRRVDLEVYGIKFAQ